MTEQERPRLDREARRAERARIARLSRLPGLYDLAQRGPGAALVATLVQVALAVGLALLLSYAVTGEWLPRWVAVVALACAYGLQFLARFLNARAGRR